MLGGKCIQNDSTSTHHSASVTAWAISSKTLPKQNQKIFTICKFLIPKNFFISKLFVTLHILFGNIYINNHLIIWFWSYRLTSNITARPAITDFDHTYLGGITGGWFSENNIPKTMLNTHWAFNRRTLNELMSLTIHSHSLFAL